MIELLSSRSRVQNRMRCPRARFWLDEAQGTGFSPVKVAIPLATGGAVHAGLRRIMLDVQGIPVQEISWDLAIIHGVQDALEHFRAECSDRQLDLDQLESQSFVYAEQIALTEALVRLAGLRVVPKILELYEVLEVERLDTAPLVQDMPHFVQPVGGSYAQAEDLRDIGSEWSVLWRSIPDALLRSRSDNDLYVLSWKTCAEYDQRRDQDARTDMQGLSEPWALEQRLVQWQARLQETATCTDDIPRWAREHFAQCGTGTIRGVQMVYLIKGQRRKGSTELQSKVQAHEVAQSGSLDTKIVEMWKTASPLIYGYKRDVAGGLPELAWASDWHCSAPHPMRKSQWYPDGICKGDGRLHRRGDDWKSFSAWDTIGVKAWMDALATRTITPEAGDPLDQAWAMPVPHFRTVDAVRRWHVQVQSGEAKFAKDLIAIRQIEAAGDHAELLDALDERFEQRTEMCAQWFHRKCPVWDCCHGPAHIAADPVGSGLFRPKTQYAGAPNETVLEEA